MGAQYSFRALTNMGETFDFSTDETNVHRDTKYCQYLADNIGRERGRSKKNRGEIKGIVTKAILISPIRMPANFDPYWNQ